MLIGVFIVIGLASTVVTESLARQALERATELFAAEFPEAYAEAGEPDPLEAEEFPLAGALASVVLGAVGGVFGIAVTTRAYEQLRTGSPGGPDELDDPGGATGASWDDGTGNAGR